MPCYDYEREYEPSFKTHDLTKALKYIRDGLVKVRLLTANLLIQEYLHQGCACRKAWFSELFARLKMLGLWALR